MHLHVLQHVPFEGPARLGAWAADRGHRTTRTRLDEGESLPDPAAPDLLVVLGGPMGVGDTDAHPWLADERAFLRAALDAGTVCLGVCLGAQLLADALGAEVGPHAHRERGWFPVRATPDAADHPVFGALPDEYVPFHWHGDSFALPPDATRMAGSDACRQQAFAWRGQAYGLQFHLETTPDAVAALLDASDDVGAGPYEQAPAAMRDATARFVALADHHDAFMDALAARHGWD